MKTGSYPSLEPEQIGAAIRAFGEPICPGCGIEKDPRTEPFCKKCLGFLPKTLCQHVCQHSMYLAAFHPALKVIKERLAVRQAKPKREKPRTRQPSVDI